MKFPDNPTNGMIFEATLGVFYQYNSVTQSWYRVNAPSVPLATQDNDGAMSAEDFRKLSGFIIPTPSSVISFSGCDTSYSRGLLKLQGEDDGVIKINTPSGNLHENTAVIDFGVDTKKLVKVLTDAGQLKLVSPPGDPGDPGDRGDSGVSLATGPQGPDGKAGKNAQWPGTLSEETFSVAQQNRAIVDISTRKVSASENYVVVTRANIGDPNACPNTILPKDLQSPWLLAFSTNSTTTNVATQTNKCGWYCNSSLYYFDVEIIIQSVFNQFKSYLNLTKTAKEQLAKDWLDAMMSTFNEQKSALCCALEACKSRSRNQDTRRYLEQTKMQVALNSQQYQVELGSELDKVYPPGANCEWNIAPANANAVHLSDPNCQIDWATRCET